VCRRTARASPLTKAWPARSGFDPRTCHDRRLTELTKLAFVWLACVARLSDDRQTTNRLMPDGIIVCFSFGSSGVRSAGTNSLRLGRGGILACGGAPAARPIRPPRPPRVGAVGGAAAPPAAGAATDPHTAVPIVGGCAVMTNRGLDTNDFLPCEKARPTCGASAGRQKPHTLTWFCGGSCELQFVSRPTAYQHMESPHEQAARPSKTANQRFVSNLMMANERSQLSF